MMNHRNEETPSGGNRNGALAKGTGEAPFNLKTTTTPQKIKGFIVDAVLTLALIPIVLLLLPFLFAMAVGSLFFGRATS